MPDRHSPPFELGKKVKVTMDGGTFQCLIGIPLRSNGIAQILSVVPHNLQVHNVV